MELNREEITKALEWCIATWDCEKCPMSGADRCHIDTKALALIKELTEENERLHASYTELTQCCTKLETLYKIECKRVDTVKADTVHKMHSLIKERCIKGGIYPAFVAGVIDQIAKEMLEG